MEDVRVVRVVKSLPTIPRMVYIILLYLRYSYDLEKVPVGLVGRYLKGLFNLDVDMNILLNIPREYSYVFGLEMGKRTLIYILDNMVVPKDEYVQFLIDEFGEIEKIYEIDLMVIREMFSKVAWSKLAVLYLMAKMPSKVEYLMKHIPEVEGVVLYLSSLGLIDLDKMKLTGKGYEVLGKLYDVMDKIGEGEIFEFFRKSS